MKVAKPAPAGSFITNNLRRKQINDDVLQAENVICLLFYRQYRSSKHQPHPALAPTDRRLIDVDGPKLIETLKQLLGSQGNDGTIERLASDQGASNNIGQPSCTFVMSLLARVPMSLIQYFHRSWVKDPNVCIRKHAR